MLIQQKEEKKAKKIWWFHKNAIPLHPQMQNNNARSDALVAQLVEHLTLNQGVQGSNPCRRTLRIKELARC